MTNGNSTPRAFEGEAPPALDPIELAAQHWAANGWSDAADGMVLVTSIMRAQQLLLAQVEAELRPFGLTFARFEMLRLLAFSRTGQLPMGKVSERLQVHAASATNAANRLERDGLVVRLPHPDDRRSVLVAITDAGRAVVDAATELLNERVFTRLSIDPDAVRSVQNGLAQLCGRPVGEPQPARSQNG